MKEQQTSCSNVWSRRKRKKRKRNRKYRGWGCHHRKKEDKKILRKKKWKNDALRQDCLCKLS